MASISIIYFYATLIQKVLPTKLTASLRPDPKIGVNPLRRCFVKFSEFFQSIFAYFLSFLCQNFMPGQIGKSPVILRYTLY